MAAITPRNDLYQDVGYIYWEMFVLGWCNLIHTFASARWYWRVVDESALDSRRKDFNKQMIYIFCWLASMSILVFALPLKDDSAYQFTDGAEKRDSVLMLALFWTPFVTLMCRIARGAVLVIAVKAQKRSMRMVVIYAALSLSTFGIVGAVILSPFSFFTKENALTLNSYLWLVMSISNILDPITNALYSWLVYTYDMAGQTASHMKANRLKAGVWGTWTFISFVKLMPFLLKYIEPQDPGFTFFRWTWMIISYQYLNHLLISSWLSFMAMAISKAKKKPANKVGVWAVEPNDPFEIELFDSPVDDRPLNPAV